MAAAPSATKAFRELRAAAKTAPGRSRAGTRCARATREIARGRANVQSAGTRATALPAPHLPRPRYCAAPRARRDTPAARIPQAAPRIRAVKPPQQLPARTPFQQHAPAGSEPAPALRLFCESTALALPVHLPDGTASRLVHRKSRVHFGTKLSSK